MAIGRISGPMLYSNLERQGVDLAVEGNLIYADVTNLRVGINTPTPDAELQVVGQSHLGNIVVTGNVISSTTGHVNLGSTANVVITGGSADYVLVTDGTGNLRWDEISNLDQTWGNLFFSGNQISITELDGNLELAANGSGYVVALNNLYAPNVITSNVDASYFNGDIRAGEIITSGNIVSPFVLTNLIGDVSGNLTGANVSLSGNVTADYINGNIRANDIVSSGNIVAPYFVGDLVGNLTGQLQGDVTGNVSGNSASFSGNVNSNWFNGNITGSNSNFVTSNAAAFYGNIFAQQVTSPTGDLHLSAATDDPNNIIRFDSVSAFDIPSGTTAQRPPTPDYGYVRYNTDIGAIEWWGGSTWVPGTNLIVSENITPDGVNAVYTLGQTTTENAILVNINGTIQQAGAGAYSVAGDQITFAEVPLATDIIEIRYIAGGVAALSVDFANIAGNVSPSANVTYDLGSPDYRWRDLWLSGNTINLGSATLSAVGDTIQLPAGSTVGGANVDVTAINANITAANAAIITANTAMKSYVDQGLADALFVAGSYGNIVVEAYLPIDPTITTIQANLGAYQTYANANVVAIQANLGAYQIYANANLSGIQSNLVTVANDISTLYANAQSQQTLIDNVNNSAIANDQAIQANIGRFYTYANTKIGTNADSNLVVLSNTPSTSNVTGALVVNGGVGISGNIIANGRAVFGQPGTTSNVVIASTTTSSSTTTGALVVKGGLGVAGSVRSASVTSGTGTFSVINYGVATLFTETYTMLNTDTTYDIDLTTYLYPGSSGYSLVGIRVTGQYIADAGTPTTGQARFFKEFNAGVWQNDSTGNYTVEGAVLDYTVFNTDATNFPAGAVGAGKAFITGSGTTTVALRLSNRTSPAVNSVTYFSVIITVQRF